MQDGSIEALLAAEGVQEDAIDGIVTGLVAWRLTKAGRPLVDKRKQRRVRTNIPLVVDHLVNKVCNLFRSPCCSQACKASREHTLCSTTLIRSHRIQCSLKQTKYPSFDCEFWTDRVIKKHEWSKDHQPNECSFKSPQRP